MRLLIGIALGALALYAVVTTGWLVLIIPGILAVLYGCNGSVFVETPHIKQDGDEGASVHWTGKNKRNVYINRNGKTYEMTRKGWRYNWFRENKR